MTADAERPHCTVDGCPLVRMANNRGLCSSHYKAWLARQDGKRHDHRERSCPRCNPPGVKLCAACEPMVCTCAVPSRDPIGECRQCRRPVVDEAFLASAAAGGAEVGS